MISIIIPVYNAEQTLQALLDDVDAQTYRDFEVILVNDGSKDKSIQIITEYAKKHDNVQIVDGDNHGVSHARNAGLELAKGEYIRFLDSDDRIGGNSLEVMIQPYLENVNIELVIANYTMTLQQGFMDGSNWESGLLSTEEFIRLFIRYYASFYIGSPCNKLYRTNVIKEHGIQFDEQIRWCEDLLFNIEYYEKIRNVYVVNVDGGVYEYINTEHSSISAESKSTLPNVDDILELRFHRAKYLCEKNGKEREFEIYWKYDDLLVILANIAKNKKRTLKDRYVEFKDILCAPEISEYVDVIRWIRGNDEKDAYSKLANAVMYKQFVSYYLYFLLKGNASELIKKLNPSIIRQYRNNRRKDL